MNSPTMTPINTFKPPTTTVNTQPAQDVDTHLGEQAPLQTPVKATTAANADDDVSLLLAGRRGRRDSDLPLRIPNPTTADLYRFHPSGQSTVSHQASLALAKDGATAQEFTFTTVGDAPFQMDYARLDLNATLFDTQNLRGYRTTQFGQTKGRGHNVGSHFRAEGGLGVTVSDRLLGGARSDMASFNPNAPEAFRPIRMLHPIYGDIEIGGDFMADLHLKGEGSVAITGRRGIGVAGYAGAEGSMTYDLSPLQNKADERGPNPLQFNGVANAGLGFISKPVAIYAGARTALGKDFRVTHGEVTVVGAPYSPVSPYFSVAQPLGRNGGERTYNAGVAFTINSERNGLRRRN